jgi:hypothetical protein
MLYPPFHQNVGNGKRPLQYHFSLFAPDACAYEKEEINEDCKEFDDFSTQKNQQKKLAE